MNKNKKIAVIVLGKRNSGKSTTWYELFKRRLRTGWKELYYDDNKFFDCFLINGSPEERDKEVEEILGPNNVPLVVLCSVQYVEHGLETIQWFIKNNYSLYIQWLNPGYNASEYPDDLGFEKIVNGHGIFEKRRSEGLTARVKDIKQFLLKNVPEYSEIDHLSYLFTAPKNQQTGKLLEEHISSTLKKYGKCYIGKTYDTNQRFHGREPEPGMEKVIKGHKDDGYKKMYVIYQSNNVEDIEHYESALLTKFQDSLYNLTTDSAGTMGDGPPYFLYAVVK